MTQSVPMMRAAGRAVSSFLWKCLLALQVGVVAAGVSMPADAAEKDRRRDAEREERRDRYRLRESQGVRGHVERRSDIITKDSHVDKKPGWREID